MREDSGFFSCHAINSYGEDRGILQLTVQGKQPENRLGLVGDSRDLLGIWNDSWGKAPDLNVIV